jgi:16S rRNA (guanine527-N7)-methyltransferase
MTPARIAELLQPFLFEIPSRRGSERGCEVCDEPVELSPAQLDHISMYIDLLLRWNARVNLTAIRSEEEIVTRHFGESFFAARYLFSVRCTDISGSAPERGAQVRVADLGSGAGFPGLPIKLWAPGICLTLIESNQKKAAFLREVARALTLTNVDIKNSRAEDLELEQSFDIVTLRAVERFENVLPIAAGLVASRGRLALLIGSAQGDEARIALTEFSWRPIPIPSSKNRILLIGSRESK